MLNSLPDLNRIGVFYRVYEAQSASKAADFLSVTKSAVSQSIKLLEAELRQELFIRKGGHLIPTQFAHELFQTIAPTMRALSSHAFAKSSADEEVSGLVRIVAPPLFTTSDLLPAIAQFLGMHPHVRYDLNTSRTQEAVMLLEQDKADICIVDSSNVHIGGRASLIERRLMQEHECMMASRDYFRKNMKAEQDFKTINRSRFISYSHDGSDVKVWFKTVFKRKPDFITPFLSVENFHAMYAAVSLGLGLGMLPIEVVSREVNKGDLIAVRGLKASYLNSLSVLRIKKTNEPRPVRLFLDFLSGFVKRPGRGD
ncbi:MAG: hypothetical protein C5B49_01200 [Bdellovibrio sp.]|nr:MAG: hypothetical protein C5B49_01200 [Bdellovibrio sp.]